MLKIVLIFSILGTLLLINVLWWRFADRRLRPVQHAGWWRGLLAGFMLVMLSYLLGLAFFRRQTRALHYYLPSIVIVVIYIWHLVILPLTWLAVGLIWPIRHRFDAPAPAIEASAVGPDAGISRRQMLGAIAMAGPPIAVALTSLRTLPQLQEFRINKQLLRCANLPPSLEGLTIVQLSDVHVGRFTRGAVLDRIVEQTNQLRPDLVLMPGDLIDFYLSDLPAAIDFVRKLDPKHGVYLCEGNHDLIENAAEFDRRVRAAGIPLLTNQDALLNIRGSTIQLLGVNWARAGTGIAEEMSMVHKLIRPELFKILMAHHPHNWDLAIDSNIDLTVAGHTHGGQLMLTKSIGCGPMMFKYFSGLYERDGKHLFVSNGVGNWFPLRLNAPAEIVHLTLTRKA